MISLSTSESEDQVEGGFLLDVVIREGTSILQLLPSEDQSLLIGGNPFLILNLGLHVFNGVGWLHLQGDGLPSESLHEDLHSLLMITTDELVAAPILNE